MVRTGDNPFANAAIVADLERAPLGVPDDAFARYRDPGLRAGAHAVVRQRLVGTLLIRDTLPSLLPFVAGHAREVVTGLPPAWRAHLRAAGVPVNERASAKAWRRAQLMLFALAGRAAWVALRSSFRGPRASAEPYVVLVGVWRSNLPAPGREADRDDLVSWVRASPLAGDAPGMWANIPGAPTSRAGGVVLTGYPLPGLDGPVAPLMLAARLARALFGAAIAGLAGRWWEIVAAEQIVHLEYARLVPRTALARRYIFNNAFYVLRPLWTYLTESRGARTTLLFYSTNIELFGRRPDHWRPETYGYRSMTWPHYAVWDQHMADLIRRYVGGAANVSIVGCVPFSDTAGPRPTLPPAFVAVFDVTPQRPASLATRGLPQPYYTPAVWQQFVREVRGAAREAGLAVAYKKKREIGKTAPASYRTTVERMTDGGGTVVLDPELAPAFIIRHARAVISMPFTSTAYTARELGVPSVFYDPIGASRPGDALAHGVPILTNSSELRAWLHQAAKGSPS